MKAAADVNNSRWNIAILSDSQMSIKSLNFYVMNFQMVHNCRRNFSGVAERYDNILYGY